MQEGVSRKDIIYNSRFFKSNGNDFFDLKNFHISLGILMFNVLLKLEFCMSLWQKKKKYLVGRVEHTRQQCVIYSAWQ